ncbi:hypothetical protein D3C87_1552610 [compost metagenome]
MQCLRPTFDVSTDTAGGVPDVIQRAQRGQFPSRQDIVHFFVFTEVRVPRLSVENLARNAGTDLDGTAKAIFLNMLTYLLLKEWFRKKVKTGIFINNPFKEVKPVSQL